MGGKAEGGRRIDRTEVEGIVTKLMKEIGQYVVRSEICGSFRRGKPDCGDIDVVVQPGDSEEEQLNEAMMKLFGALKTKPYKAKHSGLIDGVQVEVRVTPPEGWGAAVLTSTGSGKFNIIMRAHAKGLGYLLNEKGLWRDGKRVAGVTEKEIFEELGMTYKSPAQRNVR